MSQFNSIVGNNITPLGKTSPVEVTKEVEEKAAEAKFHPSIIDGRPGVLHMGQYIEDGEGETKHRKVSETIGNAGKKMWEFAKKGGRFLKGGIDRVGSVVEKGALSLDKGLGQAGEWVGGKAKSVYEFGSQQYKNAGNFVNEKTKKIEGYQTKKVGLVEGVALLAGNKTEKVLKNVKTGIGDSYNGVMNYGREALDSASLRIQTAREDYNKRKNERRMAILKLEARIHLERYLGKLTEMDQLQASLV